MRIEPPTITTSWISEGESLASLRACSHGPRRRVKEVVAEILELRARQRDLQVLRAGLVGRDERQVDRGLHLGRQLDLRLLGRLLEALEGHRVLRDVDAFLLAELVGEEADDAVVEVVAAEVAVAVGRQHLEHAVADIEDRDVEGAAAEVEDRDARVLLLLEAVRQRGRGGLVDDALDLQPRDLARVLGGLALRVVEVGGHGDDRALDLLAEVVLGDLLQLLQHHRRDLGRRVLLAAHDDLHEFVAAADHLVGHHRLLLGHLVAAAAHEALDREDGVLRVGDLLVLRGLADEALALVGERDHRGGGAVALRVDENLRLTAFHDGDARVGGAEVDADDLAGVCHGSGFLPARRPVGRLTVAARRRSAAGRPRMQSRCQPNGRQRPPIRRQAWPSGGAVCQNGTRYPCDP